MRDELAKQVYPVLRHGLKLRGRLERGDRPTLEAEQAELKRLLGTPSQPAPWGTGQNTMSSIALGSDASRFNGVRYALTCWLDEMLIAPDNAAAWSDTWGKKWDEKKLESALFETNVRYRNFWDQAGLAEATPDAADAVEAFLMCVLLGFRGEKGERADAFKEWVSAAKARGGRAYGKELPAIPETTPGSNVPLLLGVAGYRKMGRALAVTLLGAVPVVAFLVVLLFRR